ncbi:MAG: cytochrome c [Myxococcales bacterium]|nr:cytochrome c [Myxococcales bacterium]
MRHPVLLIATMVGISALAFGCSKTGAGSSASAGGEAAYAGPITSDDVATGQVVFQTYCNSCHPGGEKGKGPNLHDVGIHPAKARMFIREGSGRMPAFNKSRISDDQLEAVLAYLATMGTFGAQ